MGLQKSATFISYFPVLSTIYLELAAKCNQRRLDRIKSVARVTGLNGGIITWISTTSKPLTLEEFLKLPETKPASEYVNGKIIQKPMPQGEHSITLFCHSGLKP